MEPARVVTGRSILDAGCGAGPLAAALRDRGAQITGFDSSPAMVALARRRLGTDSKVLVADRSEPLPFGTEEFDDVVASLVLHYLEDWSGPLAELHRMLKPGGRLILSVNHPVIRPVVYPEEDCFVTSPYTEDYTFDGQTVYLTFWHRPLHAMTDAFTRAGFRISVISEPPFSPETPRELLPPDLGDRTAFLCFLFFVLEAVWDQALRSEQLVEWRRLDARRDRADRGWLAHHRRHGSASPSALLEACRCRSAG